MRTLWIAGVIVATFGCGGSAPSPERASPVAVVPTSTARAGEAKAATSPTLKSVACQALIDLPKLQPYFHLEVPERKGLITIVRGSPCDGEALTKTAAKVVFVDAKTPEAKYALEILELVIGSDTSRVMASFRLEAEGVLGQAVLEVKGDKATIVRETVAER